MPAAKQTTDHDVIRQWVEERNGIPSTVKSTHKTGETGVLRVDFKGVKESDDRNLQKISWGEFFEKFEEAKLAFLYQETTSAGQPSRFFKLVGRERARSSDRRDTGSSRGGSASRRQSTAKRAGASAARKRAG